MLQAACMQAAMHPSVNAALENKKDPADSVAAHISKLQKLWLELNEESFRIDDCRLPQTRLLVRILSTLPDEYFEFRTTWESVSREQRSVEYLLERSTMIEMRVLKKQSDTALTTSALFVKAKVHQPTKNKPKRDFSKVKCYSCHQFGYFKSNCPNKSTSTASAVAPTALKESALYVKLCCLKRPMMMYGLLTQVPVII
jgi:hypothetical protein